VRRNSQGAPSTWLEPNWGGPNWRQRFSIDTSDNGELEPKWLRQAPKLRGGTRKDVTSGLAKRKHRTPPRSRPQRPRAMPPRGPPRQAEKAQRATGSSIRYTTDGQVPLHRWHLAATIFLYHPRRKTRERLSAGERSQNRPRRVSVASSFSSFQVSRQPPPQRQPPPHSLRECTEFINS
jgi:hypothetical protein